MTRGWFIFKSVMILVLLTLSLMCISCEQDLYDKGDGVYSYMRADFVEAIVGSDHHVSHVVTDDNQRLALTSPLTKPWIEKCDTVYRAVLYYNYSGGSTAEAVGLSRITTLSVKRDAIVAKGLKTDPLGLESIWLSGNKKYLNLGLLLKSGNITEGQHVHTIAIVVADVKENEDGTRTSELVLSHWQGDVPQYYTQRTYVSLSLSDLLSDSIKIGVNTYDGMITRTFCIK